MTGKTHVLLGTAALIAITVKFPNGVEILNVPITPALGLLTVSAASYGPDIDLERSHLGQQHKIVSKLLHHRGITHTLLIPAILLFLMETLSAVPVIPSLIFGALVGWTAHIVADIFNRKGVPILWPVTSHKFHLACFKTGTFHEAIFTVLWLGGLVAWYRF